jgi:hypothetical protein
VKPAGSTYVGAHADREFGKTAAVNRERHRCPERSAAARLFSVQSYAVIWREAAGPLRAGKLILGPAELRLESGAPRGLLSARTLRYAGLSSVEMTRLPEERIHGRPTVLVKRAGKAPLAIATVESPGSLHEVVERLADAVAGASPT